VSAAIDLRASVIRPRMVWRQRLRAMCNRRPTILDEIRRADPAGASTDRSNRRRGFLAASRKRAGLACESAKVCVDVQSVPRRGIRTQSASSFASPTTPPETCRRCRRSFPNNSLQSCVMGRAAMSSSWPVGGCPDRQPMEARRSPTSGTSQVRTAVGGGWFKRENRCIVPATCFLRI